MSGRRNEPDDQVGANGDSGKPAPDFRYEMVAEPTVDRRLDTELLERAIRRHVAVHVAMTGGDETADVAPAPADRDVEGVAGIEPDTLLDALLVSDQAFLDTVVPTLLSHAVSLIVFYRAIVRPVAERLGDLWCDDEIDFVKVEVVSMRLRLMCNQLVTKRMAGRTPGPDSEGKRILLAHTTGDRHTLGFSLAEAFFQDAGWQVAGGSHLEPGPDFYTALGEGHFSVVALAFSRDDACDPGDLVRQSRQASANPGILVCLGGVAVSANPERFRQSGADIVALDAPDAVRQANAALDGRSGWGGDEPRVGKDMFVKVRSGSDSIDNSE